MSCLIEKKPDRGGLCADCNGDPSQTETKPTNDLTCYGDHKQVRLTRLMFSAAR